MDLTGEEIAAVVLSAVDDWKAGSTHALVEMLNLLTSQRHPGPVRAETMYAIFGYATHYISGHYTRDAFVLLVRGALGLPAAQYVDRDATEYALDAITVIRAAEEVIRRASPEQP